MFPEEPNLATLEMVTRISLPVVLETVLTPLKILILKVLDMTLQGTFVAETAVHWYRKSCDIKVV